MDGHTSMHILATLTGLSEIWGGRGGELGEEHVGGSPGGIGEEKWGEDMNLF